MRIVFILNLQKTIIIGAVKRLLDVGFDWRSLLTETVSDFRLRRNFTSYLVQIGARLRGKSAQSFGEFVCHLLLIVEDALEALLVI